MNPRKVGAPGQDVSIVDDFVPEERVLEEIVVPGDHLTQPSEMFRPESRQVGAAGRTAVLEFQEPMIRPAAARAVPAVRVKGSRSILRAIRAAGMLAALIALAVIGGALARTRLDLSVLSDYLAVVRTSVSALRELLPQVEVVRDSQANVVRDSGVAASTTEATDTPPAPIVVADSVTAEKAEQVQVAPPSSRPKAISKPPTRASLPSPRRPGSSSLRGAAAPPATPSLRPAIQRAEESPRPTPPIRASTSSPAAPVVSPVAPTPPAAAIPPPNPVPLASVSSAAAPTAPNPAAASASSSAAPPAVVSAPSAPPVGPLTTETRAVALALNRYQDAFSALDANAAHAVWPSVDVKALAKAFDQLEEQTFDLEGCDITVTGARAEAVCAGNARYVRKVGNRALRVEPRRWHFTLRQTSDQWIIATVDAR